MSWRTKVKGIPAILFIVLMLSSCSWLTSRRTRVGEEDRSVTQDFVPKAQYDQLLFKYNEMLRASQSQNQNQKVSENQTPVQTTRKEDFIDMVDDLNKIAPTADKNLGHGSENTIDVFSKQQNGHSSVAKDMVPVEDESLTGDDSIEGQIVSLRKARDFIARNEHNAATSLLKELDKSAVRQIKVQAKFYMAELLFAQKEYDLAMQIYEEIISKYAFSGIVLKALGRVVVCTERLKLSKKQEQYYSLLHEIFEGT